MVMDGDQAKLQNCGREGCSNPAVLTTRIMTAEGPTFDCFCKEHLRVAADYINMIADHYE